MAKALEIKTGLDKLKSWVGMTNKKRISAVVPLQVDTLPLRTLSREQCVVFATAFSTVLRLGRLSPLDLSQPAVLHFLSQLLRPWFSSIIIYYLCLLGIHLGNMMLDSFCEHNDFVLILQVMMINSGLVWCGMQMHDRRQIRTVPSSCRALGLMLVRKVFIMDMPSMILFAPKEPDMSFNATVEGTDGPIDATAIRKRIYSGILEGKNQIIA